MTDANPDEPVARRLVMPRATWDEIQRLAAKNGRPGLSEVDDVAVEAIRAGLVALREKLAEPVEVAPGDAVVLSAMDRIGEPTTNRKIRDILYGADTPDADPAGEATSETLQRMKAVGLVMLSGTPSRWSLTGVRWKVNPTRKRRD